MYIWDRHVHSDVLQKLPPHFTAPDPISSMYFNVVQGDIARQTAHGLVNTIEPDCRMECGVSGAIRMRANGSLIDDLAEEQPIESGTVVVTDGYDLPVIYLFHAVPLSTDGVATEDRIRTVTRTVLEQADKLGCRSLVVPLLGCGGGGFDLEAGATCICEEIWQFNPESLADVRVISHTRSDFEVLSKIARGVKASSGRLENA